MIRRHRPTHETAFSFDSFLDLVTNVVGIIIRLILVVWVGARSYTTLPEFFQRSPSTQLGEPVVSGDPLEQELARQRAELAAAQKQLLEQLRQLEETKDADRKVAQEVTAVGSRKRTLEEARGDLERTSATQAKNGQGFALSLIDIQKRREKITAEIQALQKLPPLRKVLRYRAPVSRALHAEQLHFECSQGRICFVDMTAMQDYIHRHLRDKEEPLKMQWQIEDATPIYGAFRMHYIVERRRDAPDAAFALPTPGAQGSYSYGVSQGVVEPMAALRGETLEQALAANSEFRHLCDGLSSGLGAVTLWVYPDSFALYRQLRDYLADRDITVAGRPLPLGMPITVSSRGSLSRGQ